VAPREQEVAAVADGAADNAMWMIKDEGELVFMLMNE